MTSHDQLASAARSHNKPSVAQRDAARPAFAATAIGMSWQLALLVLVPILGGYKIDSELNTSPYCTLVGLVVALAGSILVVRRAVANMNNFDVPTHGGSADADDPGGHKPASGQKGGTAV